MLRALLYTARGRHDAMEVLLRLAMWLERGTWCHAALTDGDVVIEGIWPRVRRLEGVAARQLIAEAGAQAELRPRDAWSEQRAWQRAQAMVGRRFSLAEFLGLGLALLLGRRSSPLPQGANTVKCSDVVVEAMVWAGDPRVPVDVSVLDSTPADLGQWLLARRGPLPPARSGGSATTLHERAADRQDMIGERGAGIQGGERHNDVAQGQEIEHEAEHTGGEGAAPVPSPAHTLIDGEF